MAKKGITVGKTRSVLYAAARILGDVQAVKKGPQAVAKRIVRKQAFKLFGKLFG